MAESFLARQAGDEEFRLAEALRSVKLFVETGLDADEIARAQELFGRLARERARRFGIRSVIDRYPALTLTTLIGHAGLAYDQGKYWESFWAVVDLTPEPDFEAALRTRLRGMLRKFGMREFDDLGAQYVQVLAVHAGIPVHCLNDLVEVIEQHIAAGRDRDGAALFEWLTEPGMGYRMGSLDVPVRNFLRFGGEVAVDIVDRIIEFAEYTVEHPDFTNDLGLDTSTTGLPDALLDALIDRLQERPFGSEARVSGPAEARGRRPAVAYNRIDDEIVIEVPYPSTAPETPWLVSFDGDTVQVYAERPWGLSDTRLCPPTSVPVPRRVRHVLLTHPGSGARHTLPVVDKDEPLLLFDEYGRALSRHTALPRGEVIAVHPGDAELLDADRGARIAATSECVPVGWRGWVARVCALDDVDGVVLRRDGSTGPVVRAVRAVGAARLEPATPLPGLSTRNGLHVYAERPTVLLPPATAASVVWWVRTRRAGTVDWLTDEEWESSDTESCLDPFDGIESGLLGLFDIVVSGPLGSDLRHTFFLAEGLVVEYDTPFRVPEQDGMSECTAELVALSPMAVDTERVRFDRSTRETEVRVRSRDRSERLILRPPHVELRVDPVGSAARWRTAATVLSAEDMTDDAVVAVRVPGDVEVDLALVTATGSVAQVEIPEVLRGNVFQVSTRVFADTARALRTSTLSARVDVAADVTRLVSLARIRPTRLFAGVRLAGSSLIFDGLAGPEMAAFVWADTAPWRPPEQVAISDGTACLPAELTGAGPLTVQVFVDDPWSVITSPARPDDTAVRMEQPGWVEDPDPARARLSRYLAGAAPLPRDGMAFGAIWPVLVREFDAAHGRDRVADGLIEALSVDPRGAVEALADSAIPQSEFPALLIRSGLVERGFDSVVRGERNAHPWLGCLMDIADLPLLKLRTSAEAERAEVAGYLASRGGPWLTELLSGKVGDPRVGVLDANTLRMTGFDAVRVEELKSACEIIPGALLDIDTRFSAVFDAFGQRQAWQRDPALGILTKASAPALALLHRAAPFVYGVVAARNEVLTGVDTTEHPWLLMSLQSLLMAVSARLAARGVLSRPFSPETRGAWARLAELCPALVATDLLIADALACYHIHNDLIGVTA
ncbi:hypothetical protein [Nocardia bovistercoris]|uniref:Uncharacterized protein n=1 Tax=Nocardia bovistercoris TaxID=2785916 RepID=A0A931IGH9_9NOCA|nr:hypothetical protein [Nocardia bovistercoris]MBH0779335.1 hypothetical protein [Nocardia bovistercoris]